MKTKLAMNLVPHCEINPVRRTAKMLLILGALVASLAAHAQSTNYFLTLEASPIDGGIILADPTQPLDGYAPGTAVTLTATVNGSNQFSGWTGSTNSTDNPLTVVMDSNLSLAANFTPPAPPTTGTVQVVWQHAHGQLARWFVSGNDVLSAQSFGSTSLAWKAVDAEDFNGDGSTDIVFQNDDGRIAIRIIAGTNVNSVTIGTVNPSWRIVGVADFDRDDDNDIVFQHASGRLVIWLMNGFTLDRSVALGRDGGGWRVATVYDHDNDGDPDLLFQHGSDRLLLWVMDGTTKVSSGSLPAPARGWRLAGVGDFDNDGKQDFLFQHGDGRTAVWNMDGIERKAAKILRQGKSAPAGWRVIGVK